MLKLSMDHDEMDSDSLETVLSASFEACECPWPHSAYLVWTLYVYRS